ncbi:MAG: hypothetical protein GC204_02450 [Chloroflexi bacterium]|nr:hypothetical protein [Chloroflexota bacterium]
MMESITCLIDSDMAMDDWMAALFLLKSPFVNVRAITIAATGESHAGPGADTALRLAALTNAAQVEVAAGRSKPLKGDHSFPVFVRLMMDARLFLTLPRPVHKPSNESAVALLSRCLNESPEKAILVALGPLTNLAEVLSASPELVEKIAMIYIMGGADKVPGNIREINPRSNNPYAEWNIFVDPYAANVVFHSGAPITLVPLDAANQVPLTPAYLEHFGEQAATSAARFVSSVLHRIYPLLRDRQFYFWDPITAVLATHNELGTFEQRQMRIVQEEGRECGRLIDSADGSNIRICTKVDSAAFEQLFLETLNREVVRQFA